MYLVAYVPCFTRSQVSITDPTIDALCHAMGGDFDGLNGQSLSFSYLQHQRSRPGADSCKCLCFQQSNRY